MSRNNMADNRRWRSHAGPGEISPWIEEAHSSESLAIQALQGQVAVIRSSLGDKDSTIRRLEGQLRDTQQELGFARNEIGRLRADSERMRSTIKIQAEQLDGPLTRDRSFTGPFDRPAIPPIRRGSLAQDVPGPNTRHHGSRKGHIAGTLQRVRSDKHLSTSYRQQQKHSSHKLPAIDPALQSHQPVGHNPDPRQHNDPALQQRRTAPEGRAFRRHDSFASTSTLESMSDAPQAGWQAANASPWDGTSGSAYSGSFREMAPIVEKKNTPRRPSDLGRASPTLTWNTLVEEEEHFLGPFAMKKDLSANDAPRAHQALHLEPSDASLGSNARMSESNSATRREAAEAKAMTTPTRGPGPIQRPKSGVFGAPKIKASLTPSARASSPFAHAGNMLVPFDDLTERVERMSDDLSEGLVLRHDSWPAFCNPGTELERIFSRFKEFAIQYSAPKLKGIPDDLYSAFKSYCHPQTMYGILADNSTRPMVITRYIMHSLVEDVLKPSLIRGCPLLTDSQRTDYEAARRDLRIAGLSPAKRAVHLETIAAAVGAVKDHSASTQWITSVVDSSGAMLFRSLTPVLVDGRSPLAAAGRAFRDLWTEAMNVALTLLRQPRRTFRYDFTPAGPTTFFDPKTMRGIEPGASLDPSLLRTGDYRVRLCVTPSVTMTDWLPDRIRPSCVLPADVLVYQE